MYSDNRRAHTPTTSAVPKPTTVHEHNKRAYPQHAIRALQMSCTFFVRSYAASQNGALHITRLQDSPRTSRVLSDAAKQYTRRVALRRNYTRTANLQLITTTDTLHTCLSESRTHKNERAVGHYRTTYAPHMWLHRTVQLISTCNWTSPNANA